MNIKIVQNNELVTFSQCMAITLDEEGGGIYSINCALQAKNPILTHIKFRISLSTNLLTNYFDDLYTALLCLLTMLDLLYKRFNLSMQVHRNIGLIFPQKSEIVFLCIVEDKIIELKNCASLWGSKVKSDLSNSGLKGSKLIFIISSGDKWSHTQLVYFYYLLLLYLLISHGSQFILRCAMN